MTPQPALAQTYVSEYDAIISTMQGYLDGVRELAGTGMSMSDVFTLMRTDEGWKIVQKAFHWHM